MGVPYTIRLSLCLKFFIVKFGGGSGQGDTLSVFKTASPFIKIQIQSSFLQGLQDPGPSTTPASTAAEDVLFNGEGRFSTTYFQPRGLLARPQTYESCSGLRAFALTVPSAWNIVSPNSASLIP